MKSTQSKSLSDRNFCYTPSIETDIRKTFARVREEQAKKQKKVDFASKLSSVERKNDA